MKKIFKKSFVLILTVLFVIGLTGCSDEVNVLTFLNYGKTHYAFDADVDGIVCENDTWALIWDDQNKRVSFLDKNTNIVWGQTPSEVIEKQNQTGITLPQLNSAITVAYQDPTSMDEIYLYSYEDAYQNGEITVKIIDNGIRVIYNFSEFQFAVPVEYTINDETFDIKITPAHIAQGDEFKVTAVKVAPFTCGVANDAEDSWLFIPDGTGAIVEPFVSDTLGAFGQLEVYGHDLTTQLYGYGNKKQQVHMPVFGVKKGNNALFAVIDSGAAAATINWELGSDTFGCSTVYSSFRIRGTNLIERPANFISITTLSEINVFTDGVLLEDIRIKYYPLNDAEASITGMASCYRDYLADNYGLTQSTVANKTAAFKIVGGTVQSEFILGIPSSKLFALTTTEQALKIAQELQKELGNNIMFDLVGFGKSGVDVGEVAGGFKTASALGGNSGMKELNKFFKTMEIDSYMDFDLIAYSKSGSGFNKNSAATYDGGQIVTFTSFDTLSHVRNNDRFYVLSRQNLIKAANKLIDKAKKMNLSGISLGSVSNTSYSDHTLQEYYAGGKIATDVAGIFANVKNGGYNVLSSSANIYAAINSSEIIDAPIYSSNFNFTAYDVPFYQMVLKGYVPMSSVSINLCGNPNDALLRCVSSGIAPSYTLINNYDNELVTSDHAFIHASVYSSNKDEILSNIDMVSDYLKSVEDAEISEYTVIMKDVVLTKFSNGVWAVVNFSDNDVSCEYGKVSAQSFISGREE